MLGDRFEILAAVAAALVARVPVAHLHGGEVTEGSFDDAIRHSITKMSHLHFVAAEEYRKRVIQLGEQPDRVFLVGGLGIDNINRLALLDRPALEESLGIQARRQKSPGHLSSGDSGGRKASATAMGELLSALDGIDDTQFDIHDAQQPTPRAGRWRPWCVNSSPLSRTHGSRFVGGCAICRA